MLILASRSPALVPMTQVWAMTPVMESAVWSLMLIFWDWDIGSLASSRRLGRLERRRC